MQGLQHVMGFCLLLHNVAGLEFAILASSDVEGNCCSLVEGLESIHLNFGEVNEQIFAVFLRDETVALLRVEPFDSTFRHANSSFLSPKHEDQRTLRAANLAFRMLSLRKLNHYTILFTTNCVRR